MKTFYDVLNVAENATVEEISLAYQELKDKYKNSSLSLNENDNILKKLDLAYSILSDVEKRNLYDKDLANMRNNELMNNLQKNTSTYNDEIKKQEELQKKNEEEKRLKEEALREQLEKQKLEKEKEEKIKLVQAQIEKQIENQKKQLDQEQKQRKKLEEAKRAEYKNYLRSMGVNVKEQFTVKQLFRTLISTIIVCGIVIIILQIPFIKNAILNNEVIKSVIDIFNIK